MKCFGRLLALVVAALLLSSCGDSHDKLMKDQISWVEEMTDTVNGLADGSISSSEAAEKIKALGKEGGEFMERKKVLNKEISPEEIRAVADRHREELAEVTQAYLKSMENLARSGRMTKEFGEAMMNIKGP